MNSYYTNIMNIISKLNVNDGIINEDDYKLILDYLNETSFSPIFFNDDDNDGVYRSNGEYGSKYVLAFYEDGYEKSDEEKIFSYIKHTNKLLVMKLYNIIDNNG